MFFYNDNIKEALMNLKKMSYQKSLNGCFYDSLFKK